MHSRFLYRGVDHEAVNADLNRFLGQISDRFQTAKLLRDEAKVKHWQEVAHDFRQEITTERVIAALVDFQKRRGHWAGTVVGLFALLQPADIYNVFGDGFWPSTPQRLRREISQEAPLLWLKGVSVTKRRGLTFVISAAGERSDFWMEKVLGTWPEARNG